MSTSTTALPGAHHETALRTEHRPAHGPNVGDSERWISLLAGGGLALYGLSRRSWGGLALAVAGGSLIYRGATGHCYMYEQLGINTTSHSPAIGVRARHGYKVEKSVLVNRPANELYRFWRDVENLPKVMSHLVSVQAIDDTTSHWTACGPLGKNAQWDAEIINEREGEMIAWRSLEGSEVDTAGSVHFEPAPGDRGTIIQVSLKYDPPLGKAGAAIAGLFGRDAEQQLEQDLSRFKQVMEAGETA